MLPAAIPTLSHHHSPILLFVVVALLAVVLLRPYMKKRRTKKEGIQITGNIVQTRIRERLSGEFQPYGTNTRIAVLKEADESSITFHNGYSVADMEYEVTLGIEYIDPASGNTMLITKRTSIDEARVNLGEESFVPAHSVTALNSTPDDDETGTVKTEAKTTVAVSDFIQLSHPVPVTLWIDVSRGALNRHIVFEWTKD